MVIVAGLLLASCDAGNGKNDILGFSPGMTRAEAHSNADAKKWKCEADLHSPQPNEEVCFTMTGRVRLNFARKIEGQPLLYVFLDFSTTQTAEQTPLDSQAKDISAQYGKKPDSPGGGEIIWNLDRGNVLTLSSGNSLVLGNEVLSNQDDRAVGNVAKTPSF